MFRYLKSLFTSKSEDSHEDSPHNARFKRPVIAFLSSHESVIKFLITEKCDFLRWTKYDNCYWGGYEIRFYLDAYTGMYGIPAHKLKFNPEHVFCVPPTLTSGYQVPVEIYDQDVDCLVIDATDKLNTRVIETKCRNDWAIEDFKVNFPGASIVLLCRDEQVSEFNKKCEGFESVTFINASLESENIMTIIDKVMVKRT